MELAPNGVVVNSVLDLSGAAEWIVLAMERGKAKRIVVASSIDDGEIIALAESLAAALAGKSIADALAA